MLPPTLSLFQRDAEKALNYEQRSWAQSITGTEELTDLLPLPLPKTPPTSVPINYAPPNPSPGGNCILFVPISRRASPFSYGMGFRPSCC